MGDLTMNNQNYYIPVPEPNPKPSDSLSVVSLIMGILSILFGCCCGYFSIIFSIVGLVCAIVYKNRYGSFNGMALAGLIMSCIGIVFFIVAIVLTIFSAYLPYNEIFSDMESYYRYGV